IDKDPEDEDVKRNERELWEKIKAKSLGGRRTGLGITAEGDMLAALGLRYGSEEAIKVGVLVQKTLALSAYASSVQLAQERGPFPIFDANRELRNPMIERIRQEDEELYQRMVKAGRRNISMLTIAPTGTTSLMTQTTSGIEQVFLPVYQRRKKVNPNDKNVTIAFTDKMGDAFEEYNVFHHKFLDWAVINGYDRDTVIGMNKEELAALVDKSPYYKATANDVDWVAKVKMQGQMQKWVDHSISVTVNLPADVTEDMVAEVYRTAWEWGCKGVTVYRDGSRTGVLVSADGDSKTGKMMQSMPKQRPIALDAEVIRFKNANEQWIAFVGLYEGRPYEIFTGKLDEDTRTIPKSITMGQVIKVVEEKGSRYDFKYIDKYGYPNTVGGISHMFNQAYWNYAKLISGVLRNGLPVEEVVHLVSSLELDSQTINNWKSGVERALKRYIPNGTKDSSGAHCEKCGSENLVYQEGCLLCMSCGFSKCG
ncbi:MAG TPA: ribonucleoside-diphosphate reductase, adenosylcobalamin-dependent, partial [Bacteroidales bacterium]|nr:ribonucleoside-diphosphate reductase, adenosylcobalamin-dependent [Bacteroidales bacterium]